MLLGEDSLVLDYWRKIGRDAVDHGIKGVILMVNLHERVQYQEASVNMFVGSSLVG